MRNAASLLTAASFLLLSGWATLFVRGLQAVLLSALLSWTSIILHLLGWLFLYHVLFDPGGNGATKEMRIVFVASPILVIVLLIANPHLLGFLTTVVFAGMVPMIPFVFAPVSAGHGLIFLLGVRGRATREGAALMVIGGTTLVGIAVGALVAGLVSADLRILALAGLTGVGYLLVGWGWAFEHRQEVATHCLLIPGETGAGFRPE